MGAYVVRKGVAMLVVGYDNKHSIPVVKEQ